MKLINKNRDLRDAKPMMETKSIKWKLLTVIQHVQRIVHKVVVVSLIQQQAAVVKVQVVQVNNTKK